MYTISQVSSMLDIPAVTIRAWEQRHGVVEPERAASGYRMYSDQDVQNLRWIKSKIEDNGMTIGQAAHLLKQERHNALLTEPFTAAGSPNHSAHLSTMEKLYQSLISFRSKEGSSILDIGFSMFGYEAMIGGVLLPLMLKVGDEWEAGRVSVAQEHFVTQFISQRCFGFFHLFPIDPVLPRALALCPSGEQHHMGLLLFSLYLRNKGMDVLYLGPDTPEDGLQSIIREQQIQLVCLSLSDSRRTSDALSLIDQLKRIEPQLTFALGGGGFQDLEAPYCNDFLPIGGARSWDEWFHQTILPKRLAPFQRERRS